jgi:hypothetical protein
MSDGHSRVGLALLQVRKGLAPYVESHMTRKYGVDWKRSASGIAGSVTGGGRLDAYALLKTVVDQWRSVFEEAFDDRGARNIVGAALDLRNKHAHAATGFTDFEAIDALGNLVKLLGLVGASKEQAAVLELWEQQRDDRSGADRGGKDASDDPTPAPRPRQRSSRSDIAPGKRGADSGALFVQVLGDAGFKRTYYGPILLTRKNFRGAAPKRQIDCLDGTGVEIFLDGKRILARRRTGCPPCRIDGIPMKVGVRTPIGAGDHRLEIAGLSLSMTTLLESP